MAYHHLSSVIIWRCIAHNHRFLFPNLCFVSISDRSMKSFILIVTATALRFVSTSTLFATVAHADKVQVSRLNDGTYYSREKKRELKQSGSKYCGIDTEFDQVRQQCVQKGFAYVPIPKCKWSDASCFCDTYGYAERGPKLGAHPNCRKYASCYKNSTTGTLQALILECEPGFAYDEIAQVCFFKESVDCSRRVSSYLGSATPSKCLSELTPEDPICGCVNYVWNSATPVPDHCYASGDADFQCTKDSIVQNMLEIGIGDGIRPGRAPPDFTETEKNTGPGYLDAPWLASPEILMLSTPTNFLSIGRLSL